MQCKIAQCQDPHTQTHLFSYYRSFSHLFGHKAPWKKSTRQDTAPEFLPFYLLFLHSTIQNTPTHGQYVLPIAVFYRRRGPGTTMKICHFIVDVCVCWRLQERWHPLGLWGDKYAQTKIQMLYNTTPLFYRHTHLISWWKEFYLHHIRYWLKRRSSTMSKQDLDQF